MGPEDCSNATKDPWAKECIWPPEAEKGKKIDFFFPWNLQKEHSPSNTLILNLWSSEL